MSLFFKFYSNFLLYIYCVQGFNIDDKHPLVFNGEAGTEFGYTSGIIRNSEGLWLIVGAPKGNFTDAPEIVSPGNVYKCPINITSARQTGCDVMRLRSSDRTCSGFNCPYEETKELLGGSLVIAGNTAVVCAPLWKNLRDVFRLAQEYPTGYCFQLDQSLRRITTRFFQPGAGYEHQLMIGFSAAVSEIPGFDIVLGIPGVSFGIGGIVMYRTNASPLQSFYTAIRGNLNQQISQNFLQQKGSYIGYSVASGYFGPLPGRPLIVAGAPHFSNARGHVGTVLMLRVNTNAFPRPTITPVKILDGDQIGGLFGASLLVVDVNGDDIDDLLIGSPQYHVTTAAIDQGKVDVYHGTGNSIYIIKNITIQGLSKPESRFGTSMTSIGDITGDNYNDIVVGAPFEDDMVGAIYIFNGGPSGINPVFSQRISGDTVQQGLKSFGWHLSQTFDIDNNLRDDVSVGSYLSDKVVLLRSRPVVSVTTDMSVNPMVIPLNSSGADCVGPDNVPCVTVSVCYRYVSRGLDDGIYIDYELKSDALRLQNRRSSRVNLFLESDSTNYGPILKQRIKIPANGIACKTIYGRVQGLTSEFYRLIQQELSFLLSIKLADTQSSDEITPILDINSLTEMNKSVRFEQDCQALCRPDLSIRMTSTNVLIVGETTEKHVLLELQNSGDTSYATSINIRTSNNTAILGIRPLQGSMSITCNNADNSTMTSELNCDINGPIRRGRTLRFTLRLDTSLTLLLPSGRLQDLESNFTVMSQITPTAVGSTEIDVADNIDILQVPIHIKTNVEVSGESMLSHGVEKHCMNSLGIAKYWDGPTKYFADITTPMDGFDTSPKVSQPRQRRTSNQKFQVMHTYEIYNTGPSPLPAASVVLLLPVKYFSGQTFIEESSLNVTIKGNRCKVAYYYRQNSSNTMMSTTIASPATQAPSNNTVSKERNITCDNVHCARIQCDVPEVGIRGRAMVKVVFVITEDNLDFKSTDLAINYQTTGTLYRPAHPLVLPWQSRTINYQVVTKLFSPEVVSPTSTKLNIGIIIGGVVGGIVAIIILGLILRALGFFNREKKKEAIKELKRKSIAIQKRRTQMMFEAARASSAGVLTNEARTSSRDVLSENEVQPATDIYPHLTN